MWKVKFEVRLVGDAGLDAGREVGLEVEEELPGGLEDLDQWEQAVRRVGFGLMRELFKLGIKLLEARVLSGLIHRDAGCKLVKRGRRSFGLKTVFGRVRIDRQRMFCERCGEWMIPLNGVLDLHDREQGRATLGLQALSSWCAVHQSYRLAHQMVGELTQDRGVLSVRQLESIVDREGARVRKREEEERHQVSLGVVREIQEGKAVVAKRKPKRKGRLYVCLDGILVHSTKGKGCWREGKVALVCTDAREAVGKKGRKRIPTKRYISSFEGSDVFGSRVYAEAVKLGLREYAEVIVLGDGARWIRQIHKHSFRDAVYVLDWYHLERKVSEALRQLLPEQAVRRRIRQVITLRLWEGQLEEVLRLLGWLQCALGDATEGEKEGEAKGVLEELMAYLEHNREGIVCYARWHQAGYLVASSLVEKAADVVVAKRQKKHQGMHWSTRGADGVSALRTLWLNGDWEGYWKTRHKQAA